MLRVQLSEKDESVLSFTPLNSWPNHQPKSYSMKKFIASIALFVAIGAASNISAQDYKTALGIRLSSSQAMVNNSVSIKVVFRSAVSGTMWPMNQKTPQEMRLPDFRWLEERRPKTKYEMFE